MAKSNNEKGRHVYMWAWTWRWEEHVTVKAAIKRQADRQGKMGRHEK